MQIEPGHSLWRFLLRHYALVCAVIACSIILALTTSAYAYLVGPLFRYIFSSATESTDPFLMLIPDALRTRVMSVAGESSIMALMIIALALVKGAAYLGQTAAVNAVSQRFLYSVRTRLFSHLLRLRPQDLLYWSSGDIAARFSSDLERVEKAISGGLLDAFANILLLVALLTTAILIDPVLGMIALFSLPFTSAMILKSGSRVRRERNRTQKSLGDVSAQVTETVNNLAVIRSFSIEDILEKRFVSTAERLYKAGFRALFWRALSSPVNEVLGAGALILTLLLSRARIQSGVITPEGFISFFTAVFLLYRPIKGMGLAYGSWQGGLAGMERISGMLSIDPEPRPDVPIERPAIRNPGLEFDNVSFSYPDMKVLRDLSLRIAGGEKVALVGESGSGKTTILQLLLRLIDHQEGRVLVDGLDIMSMHPGEARSYFAIVTQEPILFEGSIRENIMCGNICAGRSEFLEAVHATGVDSFVSGLPGGYETEVGRGGAALSGGQKQRICLARAVISRAPVLLLDELTASLDAATESELYRDIGPVLRERTAVMVSHRLSTVRKADRILVLAGGRIAEEGTYEILIRRKGVFYELFLDQMNTEEKRETGTAAA